MGYCRCHFRFRYARRYRDTGYGSRVGNGQRDGISRSTPQRPVQFKGSPDRCIWLQDACWLKRFGTLTRSSPLRWGRCPHAPGGGTPAPAHPGRKGLGIAGNLGIQTLYRYSKSSQKCGQKPYKVAPSYLQLFYALTDLLHTFLLLK